MRNVILTITLGFIIDGSKAAVEEFAVEDASSDPRLFFANYTSSLISVNSTILTYSLLLVSIVGAAAVALYYLYLESVSVSSYGHQYGEDTNHYYSAR